MTLIMSQQFVQSESHFANSEGGSPGREGTEEDFKCFLILMLLSKPL